MMMMIILIVIIIISGDINNCIEEKLMMKLIGKNFTKRWQKLLQLIIEIKVMRMQGFIQVMQQRNYHKSYYRYTGSHVIYF